MKFKQLSYNSSQGMDELDILLAAHRFMSGTGKGATIWNNTDSVKQVVPLYDLNDHIIAYYISFYPAGYAIINNNRNNPVAIEFGEGNNTPIKELLKEMAAAANGHAAKICYVNPAFSFDKEKMFAAHSDNIKNRLKKDYDLKKFYAKLSGINKEEKALHKKRRSFALKNTVAVKGGYYDFIDWDKMPNGNYTSGNIPFDKTVWAVMSDYDDIATNHCGATAATNIALYFATAVDPNLKKNGSIRDTFTDLHKRIGNGPAITIADNLKKYVSSRGRTLSYASIGSYSALKTATADKMPCGLLLTAAINDWHWVISTGWRQYGSGEDYVRIVNGWDNSANNFYLFNGSSAVWSITKYWISK